MIGSLNGVVTSLTFGVVEIEVNGVGYIVQVPTSMVSAAGTGKRMKVLTHMVVREDSMTLYGFSDADQRQLFKDLMSVTGVGPKLAMAVISSFEPDRLRRIVMSEDVDALTSVAGVGKRGASRMILELKERLKIDGLTTSGTGSIVEEVRDALVGLGYTPAELRDVLDRVGAKSDDVEVLMKAALKELSRV